jgi:hypothetical protein
VRSKTDSGWPAGIWCYAGFWCVTKVEGLGALLLLAPSCTPVAVRELNNNGSSTAVSHEPIMHTRNNPEKLQWQEQV